MVQRTFVMIKPDALCRGIVGRVITRLEDKGLKLVALKMLHLSERAAEQLYAPHKGKEFFEKLIRFTTSAPVVALVVEGTEAVTVTRRLLGATSGLEAEAGTIRGDYTLSTRHNVAHASDSPESAEREIALFFSPEEILEYRRCGEEFFS